MPGRRRPHDQVFFLCGTVAVRRRPVAPHARSAPSPWPLSLSFFDSECDGGSAAEVSDLSEMMAARPLLLMHLVICVLGLGRLRSG
jgi:hypothetical protein